MAMVEVDVIGDVIGVPDIEICLVTHRNTS